MVELLESNWQIHLDVWGWSTKRGLGTSKGRAKHASLDFLTCAVEDAVESIALEEKLIEDLIAVLLINVAANVLYDQQRWLL